MEWRRRRNGRKAMRKDLGDTAAAIVCRCSRNWAVVGILSVLGAGTSSVSDGY